MMKTCTEFGPFRSAYGFEEALKRINALGIGAQGFGGDTTALAVHAIKTPTHIAGLPVAVNIQCHAVRHESRTL